MFGKYVLCQDCLKVKPFSVARHNSDELCECGGDFCGCEDCNDDALKNSVTGNA